MHRKIHAIYATYLLLYLSGFAIPALAMPVRDFGMLAIAVLPALLIIQRGLLHNRFWQAMAAAQIAWGFAQVTWIVNERFTSPLPWLQDSAYWIFKLLVLGAILYKPFYAGTETNRRLYHVDTAVALSIIAYYIGYFFISPSLVREHISGTFYGSTANVLLNCGVAATVIIVAWEARRSGWSRTYRWIAVGLTLYTGASLSFLLLGFPYTDPLWCATFWAMSMAVVAAPERSVSPIDKTVVASRYGMVIILMVAISGIHLVTGLLYDSPHELRDLRLLLTFSEVVALATLLQFRHRAVVQESDLRRDQLEVTLASLRQPIYIVDGDYRLVLANEVFNSKFKTRTGTCYSVVFGRTSPCEWCDLRGNRGFSATVEITDALYQLEFAPMASGPQTRGGVELLVDITSERKRQQQLIQTERMAALGRMIAGTAHELNNPLAIVLGNAQLLRDYSGLNFEGRRQVAAIASAAERARDIVHTFLTLSRPSESEKTQVDVAEVVRSVEHLKATELKSYGIALDLDLPGLLPVMGRFTLLQEVFLNLLDNARDAIREAGRPQGVIAIHGRITRGNRVRLDVSDNGTGIPRDHRDRIFDPFFSTKDVGQGTGLGLSIVHSIVHDHGGRIQVASDGETFTRFELEFPLVALAPNAISVPQATTVLRILAVDDEPEILSILESSLGQMGHHVECTTTGSRALHLLSKNKFDVLLLDMHLPEMDGRNIVTRLESMIPPVSVRTIIITGDSIGEEIRKFAQDHSLPLVMKPLDFDKLNELMQEPVTTGK